MTYIPLSEKDILDLLHQFESCTLPKAEWTHEAHLVVAIAYNVLYGRVEALGRARKNIIRYNEAVNTPNTDHSGYHETITCFWIWLTDCFLKTQEDKSIVMVCNAFMRSRYTYKRMPLHYYSSSLLFSTTARKALVEPDLSPLIMTNITIEN
ncbi:hypothetical protein [Chitinophaga varians]|uniref:hypothetical protein n=1 Tax=Chitinophaga varians TaxID=2202339 RepID=UPI00165EFBAF|nr:hypothetical protein [Chitinophaga varians]MBC9914252.1 hypothetical protein [Chitinophaga varians]